ncbi:MAG: DUF835 domain-containing protein [Candidatus Poseidoniaceae archaeon]|nr:DUF835 domain-containing protein [Candidatus Poseidoniaceae archaeon]
MVELPQGDVTEIRRGDRDALRLLSADFAKLATTGFIRTERKPKEQMPRVGHILFVEGHPILAIHEAEAIVFGLEALLEIEDDAAPLDALVAIHELPAADAQRICHLHPNAYLNLEATESNETNGERWWSDVKLKPRSWRREERLPELEVSVEAPESIRQKSRAYMQRYEGMERMIHPGDALLLDSQDPTSLFTLAGHLAKHGRPILVISRHDVDALSVEHNLPAAACNWLSNGTHPRALNPSIESVRVAIDAFLWENMRAVVLIEGVEYLAGMNGDDRTIDFIRDVVDGARMDDHVVLITTDLNTFELEPRHRLTRCLTPILAHEIGHWLTEPDLILDHPLCAPPTEEERQWIEQQLQRAVEHSSDATPLSTTPLVGGREPTTQSDRIEATQALSSQMEGWVDEQQPLPTEDENLPLQNIAPRPTAQRPVAPSSRPLAPDVEEDSLPVNVAQMPKEQPTTPVPATPQVVEKKGPRPAQRLRRRKKQSSTQPRLPNHVTRVAAAAGAPERASQFPALSSGRKPVAISASLESIQQRQEKAVEKLLKPSPPSMRPLGQAAKQQSAKNHHELPPVGTGPRPIAAVNDRLPHNAPDALSPLLARPGVDAEAQPKHLPREIASKDQSPPTIEDQMSVWELEDFERLRREKEGLQ